MVLIKCKFYAEMKKKNQFCPIKVAESDIVFSSCGCAAGLGPACSCKHLSALCYFLEELKGSGQKKVIKRFSTKN